MGIVKRSDKKSFYGVPGENDAVTYTRMKGFTEIAKSMNPEEYSRKYVDMDFEESDVVGYAPSISIAFDQHTGDTVHDDISAIFDKEKTGEAAVRQIVTVDFTQEAATAGSYKARLRSFAVIPGDEGGDTDRYGYSAELKAKSDVTTGTATTTDGWQTLTFTEDE